MGKFTDHIKDAAQQYNVEYNAAHWEKLEQHLDAPKNGNKTKWIAGLGIATLAAVAYFAFQPNPEIKESQDPNPVATPKQEAATIAEPEIETATDLVDQKITNTPTPIEKAVATPNQEDPVETQEAPELVVTKETETIAKPKKQPTGNTLNFTFASNKSEVCVKEGLNFSAAISEPVTYRWIFGDGNESTLPEPTHVYKRPGNYSVSLEVTSILTGEQKRVLNSNMVQVNPKPNAQFDVELLEPTDFQQKVNLSATNNYRQTEWLIDGKRYTDKNLDLPFNKKGNYPVQFISSNEYGCYDTTTQIVRIDFDYNLLAPNAFTPDNDGTNDVFLPKALLDTQLRYDLIILDASTGSVIFQTNQDGNGWNGISNQTGQRARKGNYVWRVDLYKANGEIEKFQGDLQLLDM